MERTPTPSSGGVRRFAGERTRSKHDPPRILLAEDDADMRALIAEALRKDGYVVQK
jgi:PleD family two-component response regulator